MKKAILLVAPLARHVKANKLRKLYHNKTFKTINKHWGSAVTSFFWGRLESEKTFCQLAYLATICYLY